jgi:Zn-dependent peptidase ImmA (M78 family)
MIIKGKFYNPKTIERKANELLSDYYAGEVNDIKLPIAVDKILEIHLGINVLWEDFKDDKILAGLIPQEKKVVLNEALQKDSNKGRENFTKAHEIGHWILHVDQSIASAKVLPGFSRPFEKICRSDDRDWDEKNADKFASYLLMPEKIVNMHMQGVSITNWNDIRKMAEKFSVSAEAMKIKLESLNFLYVDKEGKFFKSKAEFTGQKSLI